MTLPGSRTFASVLEARRSQRIIHHAPLGKVVNAIAFATKPRFYKEGDNLGRTRRPAASAGALHPISLLLIPERHDPRLLRYNPDEHALEELAASEKKTAAWFERCKEVLPDCDGTALIFLAEIQRVNAVYQNALSLLWRDAGSLLQTMALVSEAYGLSFCPLGLLGNEIVEAISVGEGLVGVGSAIIGEAPG